MVLGSFLAACGNQDTTSGSKESSTGSAKSSDDPITIQLANHYPTGHLLHEVTEKFMDRTVELSGGKVRFEYYPAGQLGGINEIGGLVKDGAIDIGFIFPQGVNFLPLNTVVALPSKATNPIDGGKVYDQLLQGVLKNELEKNNLTYIFSSINLPNDILTSKTKIDSAEDLKGLDLFSPGGILHQNEKII